MTISADKEISKKIPTSFHVLREVTLPEEGPEDEDEEVEIEMEGIDKHGLEGITPIKRKVGDSGLDPNVFNVFGPTMLFHGFFPREHPVPFIGVRWRGTFSTSGNRKDMPTLDETYDDLGLKDVRPHPGGVADHKKGLTCCWCRSTFFNNDVVKHIESIFAEPESNEMRELLKDMTPDEVHRWKIALGNETSEEIKFGIVKEVVLMIMQIRYQAGQSVVFQHDDWSGKHAINIQDIFRV